MNNVITEEWRQIIGYEGIYEVSNLGRVKSLRIWNGHKEIEKERMLNPYKQKGRGEYYRNVVKLFKNGTRKDYKVHRLVAMAFLPNPNNYPQVNHIDGNPLNNRVDNLEWCSAIQNIQHSIDNELIVRRINTIDRQDLIDLLNNGYNYDEIAELLHIAKGTVFNYIKKFEIKKLYY